MHSVLHLYVHYKILCVSQVVSLQPPHPQPGTSGCSTDAGISLQQPDAETVRELTQTCTRLHSQVLVL
jgi:hypothetical protein